jgi:hypothetical protein
MPHSSLRKLQVAIYKYGQSTDEDTGITTSSYLMERSDLPSGLWWASRGIVFGKEAAPANNPQDEQTSFWSLEFGVPLESDDVIATGTLADDAFTPVHVFRVQSIVVRDYFRREIQAYCTQVDDADSQYQLSSS